MNHYQGELMDELEKLLRADRRFDNGGTATVAHCVTPQRGPQASRTLRSDAPCRVTSFAACRRMALQDDQPATI
jgi:hypothetical protein